MNSDVPSEETWYNTDRPAERTWPWIWLGLVVLGLVALEVLADPAIIICVGCSKLGWNDLVTAAWLRRRDPDPRRGATWFWFYLAYGLWKTTVTALSVTLLLLLTAKWAPRHWQISLATWWLCLATFALSSTVTCVAVFQARRRRLRVWVNSSIGRSRARDEFPPCIAGPNRANRLVATASLMIVVGGLIVLSVIVALSFVLLDRLFPNARKDNMVGVIGGLAGIGIPVFLGVALLVWRDLAKVVLSAHSPEECW